MAGAGYGFAPLRYQAILLNNADFRFAIDTRNIKSLLKEQQSSFTKIH